MTKHEYHIALVLLLLITAGVLGYQALNGDKHRTKSDCTLALYFSGPYGCNNTPQVESISAPVFAKKIEEYFSPRQRGGLHDLDIDIVRIAHEKRPAAPVNASPINASPKPGSSVLSLQPDIPEAENNPDRNESSFLLSDSHQTFLKTVID